MLGTGVNVWGFFFHFSARETNIYNLYSIPCFCNTENILNGLILSVTRIEVKFAFMGSSVTQD